MPPKQLPTAGLTWIYPNNKKGYLRTKAVAAIIAATAF
jgi:hypothetical protein